MDKRQLWPAAVMPRCCCAVLTCVDYAVSIPRAMGSPFRDSTVVPVVNPSFCGCFSWMQKSWGQRWFSLPLLGWDGDPVEGRACHWRAQRGGAALLTCEKLYPGPDASRQNLTEGIQHKQCLTSYFSPIIGNTVLLSPQGLCQSSATHVYFLFGPLLMCLCQQTCSLPAVVLSAEENTCE